MISKRFQGFVFFMVLIFADASAYSILNWSNANDIRAIVADDAGFWAITTGGVVRWPLDGQNYEKFSTRNGLNDNWTLNGALDRSGALWVGSLGGGLMHFDGTIWEWETTVDGIPYDEITTINVDRNNRIWVGFGGAFGHGLGIRDAGFWRFLSIADGLPSELIRAIAFDNEGAWLGGPAGLVRIVNDQVVQVYTVDQGLPSNDIRVLHHDPTGDLWIGTIDGLGLFDGVEFMAFHVADGLPSDRIQAIAVCENGQVWAGTLLGLAFGDRAGWQTFGAIDGNESPNVTALETESNGLLVGLHCGGVHRMEAGSIVAAFKTTDGLPHNEVRAIAFDDVDLWFATAGGGIGFFDGVDFRKLETGTGIDTADVRCLTVDQGHVKWFGTHEDGLYRFDGAVWTHYMSPNKVPADSILGIYVDEDNKKWFATFGGGICWTDDAEWGVIDEDDGLPINYTYDVNRDKDGSYWFATDLGVSRYDGQSMTSYYESDGLIFHRVYEIEVDDRNVKWFGACKGLSRFENGVFTNYMEADGLAHYRVREIVFDADGLMWIATGGGANTYDGIQFRSILPSDGLAGYETFCVVKGPNGSHWFSSEGGISAVFPDSTPTPTPAPCPETGISLQMPDHAFSSGQSCYLSATICNNSPEPIVGHPLFIVLEAYSELFYGPSFTNELDSYLPEHPSFPPGPTSIEVIGEFNWPAGCGTFSNACFYGALVNPAMTGVVGAWDAWPFAWSD